jgi:hypothetical protein
VDLPLSFSFVVAKGLMSSPNGCLRVIFEHAWGKNEVSSMAEHELHTALFNPLFLQTIASGVRSGHERVGHLPVGGGDLPPVAT